MGGGTEYCRIVKEHIDDIEPQFVQSCQSKDAAVTRNCLKEIKK